MRSFVQMSSKMVSHLVRFVHRAVRPTNQRERPLEAIKFYEDTLLSIMTTATAAHECRAPIVYTPLLGYRKGLHGE